MNSVGRKKLSGRGSKPVSQPYSSPSSGAVTSTTSTESMSEAQTRIQKPAYSYSLGSIGMRR